MMFRGAKFCSHCGAKADRQEVADNTVRVCPHCRVRMKGVIIGKTALRECPKCEGLWADAESLQRICTDREQQSAVLGAANQLPTQPNVPLEKIRYVPCPVCHQLMNRMNFARCSHVVVDVCRQHGTWFDKDELRRMVEFIQSGGFDKARALEISRLERERQELKAARTAAAYDQRLNSYSSTYDVRENALSFALGAIVDSILD